MPEERAPVKPLPLQMLDLISGYWVSQLLYVAARLGLADTLKQGPMKVDDLAKQVDVDKRALYRMMRALASVGAINGSQSLVNIPQASARCLALHRGSEARKHPPRGLSRYEG